MEDRVYKNKFDTKGDCSANGHKAEVLFKNLAIKRNWVVKEAEKSDNIHKHIDFFIYHKHADLALKIDVKSRKKISRKDKSFNNEWTWLEYKNVKGHAGWLLGESSHIAFEREDEFVVVPREELFLWSKKAMAEHNGCNGKVTINCKAKNAEDARYKYHQRRKDLVTLVKYQDMIDNISNVEIWNKLLA